MLAETTGATNLNRIVDGPVQLGNNIYCTVEGIIYMREAPEPIIRNMTRGNKFDRTDEWLERHDFVPNGQYIGNCHTLRYHELGCTDIKKMNDEHKVETDNEMGIYGPCGHCKPESEDFTTLDNFRDYRSARDEPSDIELCLDPKIKFIFKNVECDCGSKDGILKMRPHSGGVRLLNRDGKWWIYRECYSCGYQLSLAKAFARRG